MLRRGSDDPWPKGGGSSGVQRTVLARGLGAGGGGVTGGGCGEAECESKDSPVRKAGEGLEECESEDSPLRKLGEDGQRSGRLYFRACSWDMALEVRMSAAAETLSLSLTWGRRQGRMALRMRPEDSLGWAAAWASRA